MSEISISQDSPTPVELARMYQDAGWIENPDLTRMEKVMESQSEWFVARGPDGALFGLGRFITDYVRYAFIVDLIVAKPYRGQGIGTSLMNAILEQCKSIGIDSVNLWPSKGKVPFYEKFGFYSLPSDQPHMKLGST